MALHLIKPIAARHGARVVPHPFNLGYVFRKHAYVLMDEPKAKIANRITDLHRWARRYKLPFRMPTKFPIKTSPALQTTSFLRDVGFDVKYGVTGGMNADLTYNTDFAQVEVDEQQVNLTRFSLFFPEKRDFFLENAGQFKMGTGGTFTSSNVVMRSRSMSLFLQSISDPGNPYCTFSRGTI